MKNLTNTSNNAVRRGFAALLLWSLILPILIAQSVWTGGAGTTNWNTSGNWTGGVPAAGKTVTINTCTTCPVITTTGNQASFVQVYAGGKLTIGSSGKLTISNPGGPGMKTQTNSQVNVSTGSSLTIQNFWGEGLSVQGAFNNNGNLTINGGHTGVAVASGGAFANGPTGNLSISGSSLNYGMVIEGIFNNQNILSIDDANNDGIHLKTGTTMNLGGTVNITKTGVNAIFAKGTINNSGNLAIDNGLNGIYLLFGTINNTATGKIAISGSAFLNDGIYVDPGTFNNSGELTIQNAQSKGMEISSGSVFNNFNKMTLNVPAWAGIFNVGGSNFTNKPCALIESNAAIVNYATFTNNGVVKETSTGSSQIGMNNGTVLNLNGGTFSTSGGNPVIFDNINVWTGCISTVWDNPKNWLLGTVPTAVTLNSAIVQNVAQASGNAPVVSTPASAAWLTLDKNATLTIASGGALSVGTYEPFYSTFYIHTGANLVVLAGGSFGATSINLSGSVQNSGSFTIVAPFHSVGGITMEGGTFTNNTGSQFTGKMGYYGAGVNVNMSNGASFSNNGLVSIGGFGGFLLNQSSVSNNSTGTIVIASPSLPGGQLNLQGNSNFLNIGALTVFGRMKNEGSTFENKGQMSVGKGQYDGILNDAGNFTNNGTLNLSQTGGNGIQNKGEFKNNGTLILNTAVAYGILNYNTFQNQAAGHIEISNTNDIGIYNVGTFINSGFIQVKDTHPEDGIASTNSFTNNISGIIYVSNIGNAGAGLWVISGSFSNSGILNIDGTELKGIDIWQATFINHASGQINVKNTNWWGLDNQHVFENYGNITIEGTGWAAINNGSWKFDNHQGGVLTINNAYGGSGIQTSNGFFNSGSITMTNSPTAFFIEPSGYFNNHPCSYVSVDGLIDNRNVINNQGLFRTTFTGTNSGPGNFNNHSVVEDFYGSFNGANFTNNAIRVRPIAGTIGGIISNALEISGTPPFQFGSTWYKNANLTDPAGSYVNGLNTFTPTIGVGTHTLYFSVKDLVNNCTKTVSIKVSIASPLIGFGGKEDSKILLTNAPNPFSDRTQIKVSLPVDTEAKLVIYDNMSRLVEVIYEGEFIKDELYQFDFNAADKRVGNYMATLILKNGRAFTLQLVKADNR